MAWIRLESENDADPLSSRFDDLVVGDELGGGAVCLVNWPPVPSVLVFRPASLTQSFAAAELFVDVRAVVAIGFNVSTRVLRGRIMEGRCWACRRHGSTSFLANTAHSVQIFLVDVSLVVCPTIRIVWNTAELQFRLPPSRGE